MKDKIINAIKIISKLGEDFDDTDWHKACIAISNLGLSEKVLSDYMAQNPKRSVLGDFPKGDHYEAANFIRNFIKVDSDTDFTLSYIKEIFFMTKEYLKAVQK